MKKSPRHRRTARAAAALVVLLVACACVPARAAPPADRWTSRGADTLPVGTRAFEFRAGAPSLVIQFDIPVTDFMEINPYISYDYMFLDLGEVEHGLTAGVGMKFNVFRSGGHAVSAGFDTAFMMAVNDSGYVLPAVMILAPEFRYSYRFSHPRIAVITGFRVPYLVVGPAYYVPMLFRAGMEYNVTPSLNIHASFEAGPMLGASDDGPSDATLQPGYCIQAGISYLW